MPPCTDCAVVAGLQGRKCAHVAAGLQARKFADLKVGTYNIFEADRHAPVNLGARFARKAATPSLKSALV